MKSTQQATAQYWLDKIANSELPAITSTVKMLDKFNNDDKSSLPKLSEAILHDQALASCLLKVANNAQHVSINKITTVSRASIVLGIRAVKNICLTSKLVEGLLTDKDLNTGVHEQLTQSMASAFHAGLLAKMMAPNYADDTQEELYLAAMLYRIGETAFWSAGGDTAVKLLPYANQSPEVFKQQCQQVLGADFRYLSSELAKTWGLSDLLIKALNNPTSRTAEIQLIYFADKLSGLIANPSGNQAAFNRLLSEISHITGFSNKQLLHKIKQVQAGAQHLLESYGAGILTKHIKALPQAHDFELADKKVLRKNPNKAQDLLACYSQLNHLTQAKHEFTHLLKHVVQSIATIFSFEHTGFFLLAENKSKLANRFLVDIAGNEMPRRGRFDLTRTATIFSSVINENRPLLINNPEDTQWRPYLSGEIHQFINHGVILICPISISGKAIGMITAQVFLEGEQISDEDFKQCSALIEHLNMCLTLLSH